MSFRLSTVQDPLQFGFRPRFDPVIVFLQLVPADTGTGDDGCWTLELRLGVGDLKKQDFNGKIMILSTNFEYTRQF